MTSQPAGVTASKLDRFLGAYPLIVAYLVLLVLYAWQTTKISTPWLFTDELQWAELSRGVAHHGVAPAASARPGIQVALRVSDRAGLVGEHDARWVRGCEVHQRRGDDGLALPGYALARLFVPRLAAIPLRHRNGSRSPRSSYTGLLIPEPLAYFWSTLALWLARARAASTEPRGHRMGGRSNRRRAARARRARRAVLRRARRSRDPGRDRRARPRPDRQLVAGVERVRRARYSLLGGAIASAPSPTTTRTRGRSARTSTTACSPTACGRSARSRSASGSCRWSSSLAWLLGNTRSGRSRTACSAGSLIGSAVAFGIYTAVKASYISTQFAIRVEERNFIYVAPVDVRRRRTLGDRGPVARSFRSCSRHGAVWYLLDTTPFHNNEHFYSDAPGLSVLQWLNQKCVLHDDRRASPCLRDPGRLGCRRALHASSARTDRTARAPRGARGCIARRAAIVGWNLWGEIAAANASSVQAKSQRASARRHRPTGSTTPRECARTMFIGQSLAGSNPFWSLEFWNQSIQDVWSVDASAPRPGPGDHAELRQHTRRGRCHSCRFTGSSHARGVDPAGKLATQAGGLRLFHVTPPIRIADAYGGLSTDGANWMTTSSFVLPLRDERAAARRRERQPLARRRLRRSTAVAHDSSTVVASHRPENGQPARRTHAGGEAPAAALEPVRDARRSPSTRRRRFESTSPRSGRSRPRRATPASSRRRSTSAGLPSARRATAARDACARSARSRASARACDVSAGDGR